MKGIIGQVLPAVRPDRGLRRARVSAGFAHPDAHALLHFPHSRRKPAAAEKKPGLFTRMSGCSGAGYIKRSRTAYRPILGIFPRPPRGRAHRGTAHLHLQHVHDASSSGRNSCLRRTRASLSSGWRPPSIIPWSRPMTCSDRRKSMVRKRPEVIGRLLCPGLRSGRHGTGQQGRHLHAAGAQRSRGKALPAEPSWWSSGSRCSPSRA